MIFFRHYSACFDLRWSLLKIKLWVFNCWLHWTQSSAFQLKHITSSPDNESLSTLTRVVFWRWKQKVGRKYFLKWAHMCVEKRKKELDDLVWWNTFPWMTSQYIWLFLKNRYFLSKFTRESFRTRRNPSHAIKFYEELHFFSWINYLWIEFFSVSWPQIAWIFILRFECES